MSAVFRLGPLCVSVVLVGCVAASAAPRQEPIAVAPGSPTAERPATATPFPPMETRAVPATPLPIETVAPTLAVTPTTAPTLTPAPLPTRTNVASGPPSALTGTATAASATVSRPAVSVALAGSAALPVLTNRHRQIYRGSVANGKDLRMFTIVGDCNSQPSVYLRRAVTGEYDISALPASLRATAEHFSASFPRVSLAAGGGFTSASMNDPVWADGALCGTKQTPFECEIWVSRASVVFIQVGTGDQYLWQDFERHYRPLIEHALSKSVLPVLLTKADDLETRSGGAPPQFINNVVRRLAREYDVPLIDFWAATRDLPNLGLIDEGDLDFHLNRQGMDLHLTLTLQVLDALWR